MATPLNYERLPKPPSREKPYRAVYEPGPIRQIFSSVSDRFGIVGEVTFHAIGAVLRAVFFWR